MKISLSLVNVLAAQIRRADNSYNRSTSMQKAFATLRLVPCANILTFTKKGDSAIQRRVVCKQWHKVQPPKGGRSSVTGLQTMFADLCKFAFGQNCIIAPYTSNIIGIA